jgi:uncharacterized protein (TIGR00255 family)
MHLQIRRKMPLAGMTGFASSSFVLNGRKFYCELKSLNSKQLDIRIRITEDLAFAETFIVREIRDLLNRGNIEVHIRQEIDSEKPFEIRINETAAKKLKQVLFELYKIIEVPPPSNDEIIKAMLSFKDIFVLSGVEITDRDDAVQRITSAVKEAAASLQKMRMEEGAGVEKTIISILDTMEKDVKEIEKHAAHAPMTAKGNLIKKLNDLSLKGKVSIDNVRLEEEVALLASKMDINEEISRISAHLINFRKILKENEPAGKKLTFLCQEFLRESNTINSKTTSIEIINLGLEMKNRTERIRELLSNVE